MAPQFGISRWLSATLHAQSYTNDRVHFRKCVFRHGRVEKHFLRIMGNFKMFGRDISTFYSCRGSILLMLILHYHPPSLRFPPFCSYICFSCEIFFKTVYFRTLQIFAFFTHNSVTRIHQIIIFYKKDLDNIHGKFVGIDIKLFS